MGDFMSQNTGQFVFVVHGLDQPAVDEYISGRAGKGVVDILLNDEKMISKRLRRQLGQYLTADAIDVSGDGRIFDQAVLSARIFHEFPAQGFFFPDRYAGGGSAP